MQIQPLKHSSTVEQKIFAIFDDFLSEFICPITQMPIINPAITEDGHSYEQSAIYKWLLTSTKSPKTGLKLQSTALIPNHSLKQLIQKFHSLKNEILFEIYHIIIPFLSSSNQTTDKKPKFQEIFSKFPLLSQQVHRETNLSSKQGHLNSKNFQVKSQKGLSSQDSHEQLFQKWLKSLDSNFNCHSQYQESQLIEPYEYLLEKFDSEKQEIADRYRKDRYTHDLGLWHNNLPVQSMITFVKYDWNVLQFINLSKCEINDEAWAVFAKSSKMVFSQLKTIWIYGNEITTVSEKDLEGFSKLKEIQFSHYNGLSNPFTTRSKENIKKFKQKESNKHIYVQFSE